MHHYSQITFTYTPVTPVTLIDVDVVADVVVDVNVVVVVVVANDHPEDLASCK